MATRRDDLFKRLTQLFRGGPTIKKKVRAFRTPTASTAVDVFKKSYSQVYSNALNAFGQYDRMSRYADAAEMEYTPEIASALDIYCLAGDNRIPLLRGEIKSIIDLYKSRESNFWVYSYDINSGKYVPGLCKGVRKTGENQKIFRVTFDDGTYVRLTANHRVLLSSGDYLEVSKLSEGASIRSMYRKLSSKAAGDKLNEYEQIKTGHDEWSYTHRLIAEHFERNAKGVVHHKNFKKWDNTPENLQIMTRKAHAELHAKSNTEMWRNNDRYAKKMSAIFSEHAKRMHNTPGWTKNVFLKRRNEVFASYDEQTRKEKFGRSGQQNGMAGSARFNEKNPRWLKDKKRSIEKSEIIALIKSNVSVLEACEKLNMLHSTLQKCCRDVGIDKWTRTSIILNDKENIIISLRAWIEKNKSFSSKELKRKFKIAAEEIGYSTGDLYNVLHAYGYKNWSALIDSVNHKVISIVEDGVEDVYDLEVEGHHNFAVSIGSDDAFVIVHNSEEACASDDKGEVLHIYSDNVKIHEILSQLYYDTINVNFNLIPWTRNLVKYGDFFLFNDIHPDHGVINVFPMPVNEVEREDGFDPDNPLATRFRWVTQGNKILEAWQVSHFRLLGNDAFLPYGSSILESARRIWRQLVLIEDAMLVYRVVRSPERRVFYIDVGTVAPDQISNYMEAATSKLKKSQVIDKASGRVDLRYNPLCHFPNDIIYLCDGTVNKIIDIAENWDRFKGASVWSLDSNCNVVPTKLIWAGKTHENASFIEVTLDDGQIIKTTPEHKWLLRDGSEIMAKDLSSGMSLMPFYQRKNEKLTKKYSSNVKNNFYVNIYHPGKNEWKSGHRTVANAVYGKYEWPMIVHHKNHIKNDNRPENLCWMSQKDHAELHASSLIEYNKSPRGRTKSSETLKRTWKKDGYKDVVKNLWNDKEIRKKRIDSLTLKIDSSFVHHTLRAIDALGTTAREHELRKWLNDDETFKSYLRDLNPGFKNGFVDKISKSGFLKFLRANNIKNVRAAKDLWVSIKAPWNEIASYCAEYKPDSRNNICRYFGISKYDLNRILLLKNISNIDFDATFIIRNSAQILNVKCHGCGIEFETKASTQHYHNRQCYFMNMGRPGLKSVNGGRNHSVASVRLIENAGPAYGLTVENSTHTIAIGGSTLLADKSKNTLQAIDMIGSGVFVKQSVDEDYFIPVRGGETGTKIDSLAGGQHVSDIADVEYIQKKLFAALKVPRAYLGYDENLCLVGETPVPLLDGRTVTMAELVAEHVTGKQNWTYSYDVETGRYAPGKIVWAGQTKIIDGVSEFLYDVKIDDGQTFRVTANHPFMLRDGSYKDAAALQPGDSLMPLYRKLSSKADGDDIEGYDMLLSPEGDDEWIYTHKEMNDVARAGVHDVHVQRVIHHKDCNKLNNEPTNLQEMTWYEHRRWHAKHLETTLLRPDVIKKREPVRLAALASEQHRQKKRMQMTKQANTPGDALFEYIHGPRISESTSIEMRRRWNEDPAYRALKSKQNKEIWNDPRVRAKLSGDEHWCRRKNAQFDIKWFKQFCLDNDVTSSNQFRPDHERSVIDKVSFSIKHVQSLLKRNGFKNFSDFSLRELGRKVKRNHKVVSVTVVSRESSPDSYKEAIPVFDITIENYSNFAIGYMMSGVIVHNSSKATLAQEDIRFSRSIAWIQNVLISELEKLGMIHLLAHGFEGDDLADFSIRLSNPSTVAQMQKLELWRAKFEIAGSAPEGLVDRKFLQKEIFMLSDSQIDRIEKGRFDDRKIDMRLESEELEGNVPSLGSGGGGGGLGGLGGGDEGADLDLGDDAGASDEDAGADATSDAGGAEPAGEPAPAGAGGEEGEDLFAGDAQEGDELILASDDPDNDDVERRKTLDDVLDDIKQGQKGRPGPVKATQLSKRLYNRSRRRTHGPLTTHMPDFKSMLEPDYDPFDAKYTLGNPFKEAAMSMIGNSAKQSTGHVKRRKLSAEMKYILDSLKQHIGIKGTSTLLAEDVENDGELVIDDLLDESASAEIQLVDDASLAGIIQPGSEYKDEDDET